jgi:hypothetical protein
MANDFAEPCLLADTEDPSANVVSPDTLVSENGEKMLACPHIAMGA